MGIRTKMLFNAIQEQYPNYLIDNNIRRNFTKFLVNRKENVVALFEPYDSLIKLVGLYYK